MSDKSYAAAVAVLAKNAELATQLAARDLLLTQVHRIAVDGWGTSGEAHALKRIMELTAEAAK